VTVRAGDADDPLAGVVRFKRKTERDVDLVVGRSGWQADAVERAQVVPLYGVRLPVVTAADLVLFKLYAGGSQDCWDVEQLLAGPDRHPLIEAVDSRIGALPAATRPLWQRLAGRT
jgi:hypothetical protein